MIYNRLHSAAPAQPVADPSPSPEAFLLCPLVWPPVQGQWQQNLYEWAWNQAKAVVRPSLLERDRLAVWN